MKHLRLILIIALAGLALIAGAAYAADQGEGGPHRGMHHAYMGGGPGFGMFLHHLNLTDDQRAQVKQIMQNEKGNMKPLMQQEGQVHQQMMQLITSGKFDENSAGAIIRGEAQTHMQLEMEHAKIASQIYALLSSDQKAKLSDIMAKHQQRMQEMQQHMQNQSAAPEQQ